MGEQNEQLEQQNQELVAEIKSLRQLLAKQDAVPANTPAGNLAPGTDANRSTQEPTRDKSLQKESVSSQQRG